MRRHIHFVTGKLAAQALRETVAPIASKNSFDFTIQVLPISVAALMTPDWIAKRIRVPTAATEVMLPGYCEGDETALNSAIGVPFDKGPRDLRELPAAFGGTVSRSADYGAHSVEIIAEINHVPKLPIATTLELAKSMAADGADVIDVGCIPGSPCGRIGDYVAALCDQGHRVSIDSFDPSEVSAAVRAGAELVLSVNASNRDLAVDWGCEVVAIADEIPTLSGLDETVATLEQAGVPYRIDPILEPIGCGFAASLGRYLAARERYPDTPMMMGIGNLTELTDADSCGLNVVLLGFCEEVGIESVLTTQVIPWAQTSVLECNLARKLVYYAVSNQTIPKHLEPQLVMLRDASPIRAATEDFKRLAADIKDNNFRLFATNDRLHVVSSDLHLDDADPFRLFDRLLSQRPETIDAGHAFYLGFELAKATIAVTLNKSYTQDEALDWGMLTRREDFHRIRRQWRRRRGQNEGDDLE